MKNFFTKVMNQRGFSLVEVIIAGGIGVAIFLYLNQSLIQIQQTQRRIEKRDDVNQVKRFLDRHLADYRAWRDNPDDSVPTPTNHSNIYYYPTPRSAIKPLAYSLSQFNSFWVQGGRPAIDCPDSLPGCRIAMFDYQGLLLDRDEMLHRGTSNLFLVFIKIETPDSEISRSYVPNYKVSVRDTSTENTARVLPQQFQVNPSGSLRPGHSTVAYYEGVYVDSIARKDCFLDFVDVYPQKAGMGQDLCKHARSKAPSTCFHQMKREFQASDPVAMITCTHASNMIPYNCFKESQSLGASPSHRAILCHQAESLVPIECAEKILSTGGSSNSENVYRVCSRAQDTTPADCYNDMAASGKDASRFALALCPHHQI